MVMSRKRLREIKKLPAQSFLGRNFSNRPGFTLIELLVVMLLVGLLVIATVSAYNRTRQSAELSLLTDSFVSELRELKNKSRSTNDAKCLGIKIEEGSLTRIEGEYKNPFERCTNITEIKQYADKDFRVLKTQVDGSRANTFKKLSILFVPPRGEIYVPEIDVDPHNINYENIELKFGIKEKENNQFVVINRKNGTIKKEFTE